MPTSGSFASESEARGWLAGQEPGPRVRATDAGLRERLAEVLRTGHVEWLRPGSDAGEEPLHEALASVLLPVVEAEVEAARLAVLEEPQPARPADDGVAHMYAEQRADEFARLRARISEVAGPGADVDQVLALRELRRPFEERDRLRGNARYWIDYACAYAEARDRAEAERERLAAEVGELRTEITKRQEYLDKLRERAGKNYGDAKKLRRWLDEEREMVKAHSEETDAAEAKLARVRAVLAEGQANGWTGFRYHQAVSAALDGTGEAS